MLTRQSIGGRGGWAAAVGGLAALGLVGASWGGVLLDETWADGDHTDAEAGWPVESPIWSSHPGNLASHPGALSMAVATNSMKVWTYFADEGSAAALSVGDRLVARLELVLKGRLYDQAARGFRVGLYHDPTDPQVRANLNDDGGGPGDPWQDATGYAVEFALSSGPAHRPTPVQWFKRVNQHPSLLGATAAMSQASSGGAPLTLAPDTPYTLTLELARVSESRMDLTCSLADSESVLATQTVRDEAGTFGRGDLPGSEKPFTAFDLLFIRTTSNATAADAIELHAIRVQLIPAAVTVAAP